MARTRRPAAQARAHILEVARGQLLARGPAALRLKEVAGEAGVSHPTVLHHFGSREGLVAAVVEDALIRMDDELEAMLETRTDLDPEPFVRAMAKVFAEGGNARLMAWLALSGHGPTTPSGNVQRIVAAVHRARLRLLEPGAEPPTFDDSVFISMLVTTALIGETIVGDGMRANLGSSEVGDGEGEGGGPGPLSSAAFQARLAAMVRVWIEDPPS